MTDKKMLAVATGDQVAAAMLDWAIRNPTEFQSVSDAVLTYRQDYDWQRVLSLLNEREQQGAMGILSAAVGDLHMRIADRIDDTTGAA